ncbi:MAG: hypothetical protein RBS80_21450 [Thermoguttaceae bacterium]|jgi:hypothetical protein|nr:hypothetical protein [Thermoguttaceae bacterium]
MRNDVVSLAFTITLLVILGAPSALSAEKTKPGSLRIGWGSADITPEGPIVMSGGRRARISTGVMDPIGVTALVLESIDEDGETAELVAQVAVDHSSLREDFMDFVLKKVGERIPEIEPGDLIVFATHTHAAPDSRPAHALAEKLATLGIEIPAKWTWWGTDLGITPTPQDYADFMAERAVDAVEQALKNRKPGGVSFGLGHAVVGHNRLINYDNGRSQMYGKTDRPDFSHVEGYEDHSVNLLYTWDSEGLLTGVVVNLACSAQVTEGGTLISADYWHETREELRNRLGESLHILPQLAAAGDQSPHILVDRRAEARMERLTGRNRRQQIAMRIADAVTSVLPYMKDRIEWNPLLAHRAEQVELTRLRLTDEQLQQYRQSFEKLLAEYLRMRRELQQNPERKQKAGWQNEITPVFWNLRQAYRVIAPYELQQPTITVPVHVVRIGDMVIATSPFEFYLDYGLRIKARSRAVQTFTVELSNGCFGYLPTKRSVAGGAYGGIPTSNEVGPEGGQELVEATLKLIDSLWEEK